MEGVNILSVDFRNEKGEIETKMRVEISVQQAVRLVAFAQETLFIASGKLVRTDFGNDYRNESIISVPILAENLESAKNKLSKLYQDMEFCHTYYFDEITFQELLF